MPKKCADCDNTIAESSRRRKFCSDKCKGRFHSRKHYHQNKTLNPRPTQHPQLVTDYFEEIDSKDKAYWLGFLCADGSINENETRVQLHLSVKDEDLIDRFIEAVGANPNKKRHYGPYEHSGESVMVYISDSEFVGHLVTSGCIHDKTAKLQLPQLNGRDLDLAFLMGFFDGDGQESSCELSSSNKELLLEIKSQYKVSSDIRPNNTVWCLNLQAELFKEMLDNYRNSLPRKRKTGSQCRLFDKDMKQRPKKNKGPRPQQRKFDPDPEELGRLVWEKPVSKVGKHFGVSGNAVKKRCKKYGIETPGRGYWQKKRAGQLE